MRKACELGNKGDDSLCRAEDCPWYGEPAGCNHPTGCRDDAPYGNAAALRNALKSCRDYFYDLLHSAFLEAQMREQTSNPTMNDKKEEQQILRDIETALAEPERNCSRNDAPYGNAAALRNALLFCLPRIKEMRDDALGDSGRFLIGDLVYESCCNMLEKIEASLAEPGRNCDRGDAKETWELFLREEHPEAKKPFDPVVDKVLTEEYAGHWLFRKEKHGKEENEEKTKQSGT